MNLRRQLLARSILLLTASLSAWPALAQADYPNKPIKLIVAFPPGGTSDVMARMVAEPLAKVLGQPVLIENVGGAGGVVGTERASRAAPDGYTIIQTGVGQNAVAHGLDPALKYNSKTDFIHISQIHHGPNVLVVNTERPFKTLKELVDFAKKNPGKVDYGFTHAASGHMAMELFKQTAGIYMTGIPYRGGGPMMTSILSNEIPLMFINQDVALQHIKAGKLRPLAVTTAKRSPALPDVPTLQEAGLKDFDIGTWFGVLAPVGTPKPVLDRLSAEATKIIQSPDFRKRMDDIGAQPVGNSPAEMAAQIRFETDKFSLLVKAANVTVE
jgi:tripartite-type tricarboxylate transporter receptor subunit TctC